MSLSRKKTYSVIPQEFGNSGKIKSGQIVFKENPKTKDTEKKPSKKNNKKKSKHSSLSLLSKSEGFEVPGKKKKRLSISQGNEVKDKINKKTPPKSKLKERLSKAEMRINRGEESFSILKDILLDKKLRKKLKKPTHQERFFLLYHHSIDLFVQKCIAISQYRISQLNEENLAWLTDGSSTKKSQVNEDIDTDQNDFVDYGLRDILTPDSFESRALTMEWYAIILRKLLALGDFRSVRAMEVMFSSLALEQLDEFKNLSDEAQKVLSHVKEIFSNRGQQKRIRELSVGTAIPDLTIFKALIEKARASTENPNVELINEIMNFVIYLFLQNQLLFKSTPTPVFFYANEGSVAYEAKQKYLIDLAKNYKENGQEKKKKQQQKREKNLKSAQAFLAKANRAYRLNDERMMLHDRFEKILDKLHVYSYSQDLFKLKGDISILSNKLARIPELQAYIRQLKTFTNLDEEQKQMLAGYKKDLLRFGGNKALYENTIKKNEQLIQELEKTEEYKSKKFIGEVLHQFSTTSSISERIALIESAYSSVDCDVHGFKLLQELKAVLEEKRKMEFTNPKIAECEYSRSANLPDSKIAKTEKEEKEKESSAAKEGEEEDSSYSSLAPSSNHSSAITTSGTSEISVPRSTSRFFAVMEGGLSQSDLRGWGDDVEKFNEKNSPRFERGSPRRVNKITIHQDNNKRERMEKMRQIGYTELPERGAWAAQNIFSKKHATAGRAEGQRMKEGANKGKITRENNSAKDLETFAPALTK